MINRYDTTTDSGNLTAAKHSVTHVAAVHLHVGYIHTTIVDVAAAKDTSCIIQPLVTLEMAVFVSIRVVFNLLYVTLVKVCCFNVTLCCIVLVAYVAIQHRKVGSAPYGSTLTTTVGITCDSRNAVVVIEISGAICCCQIVFVYADNDVRLARNVISIGCSNTAVVMSYSSCPSTTIYVTHLTTLYVSSRAGKERFYCQAVFHRSRCSCSIEVVINGATQQVDVCGTIHVAAVCYITMTKTAAIAITCHGCSLVYVDVSVVILWSGVIYFIQSVAVGWGGVLGIAKAIVGVAFQTSEQLILVVSVVVFI